MKVWTTLTEGQLYDIAEEIGVKIADRGSVNERVHSIPRVGRAYSFGLRPDKTTRDEDGNYRYQRLSASWHNDQRRVFAVCWHGHRDFMRELFVRDPSARIKSAVADYRGVEEFEDKHPDTAYRNVGAPIWPRTMAEVCTCGSWS